MMIATLHEIEFRFDGLAFMVSGEIDGPTDAPSVDVAVLQVECGSEFSPMERIDSIASIEVYAVAEAALIKAAEDRRLVFSCGDCGVECYGEPTECPSCEDRKEAAIARAMGK